MYTFAPLALAGSSARLLEDKDVAEGEVWITDKTEPKGVKSMNPCLDAT